MMSVGGCALELITKTQILILQLFVLKAKHLRLMTLFRLPTTTESRLAQVDKKAGDKHTND